MARVKPDYLIPQSTKGYHGAIQAIASKDIGINDILVVVGTRGDRLIVDKVHCSTARLTTGPFFVAGHASPKGQTLRCLTFKLLNKEEAPLNGAREGTLAYAGLNGTWTLKEPKANATLVGKVIATDEGKALLLAPGLM
jgi:hypothetical protein